MVQRKFWLPDGRPWADGLRLAVYNLALAVLCALIAGIVLVVVTLINRVSYAAGAGPGREVPFPYPLMMLVSAGLFLGLWLWFGWRLPGEGKARALAVLVGAAPLWILAMLAGGGAVLAAWINTLNPTLIGAATVFLLFGSALGLLLASGMCAAGVWMASSWARSRDVRQHAPLAR